jgi:type VI secretion system secreted protein Hcp
MAADAYLKIQTRRAGAVKGEANAPDHKDDISIRSWNWGAAASSAVGASAVTARRSYRSLTVIKGVDTASTALLSALATNDEVKEAKLMMRKAGEGQQDFFSITLKNARVATVDLESDAEGNAVERVTFTFTKVDVEYRPQQGTGARGATFSFSDELLPV